MQLKKKIKDMTINIIYLIVKFFILFYSFLCII